MMTSDNTGDSEYSLGADQDIQTVKISFKKYLTKQRAPRANQSEEN